MSPVLDIVLVVAIAFLITLGAYRVVDGRTAAPLEPEELTPIERPTLNPSNAPLVTVLYGVAASVEESGSRVADGLRDIARTIQMFENQPVGDLMRERIARQLDEHSNAVKRGAQHVREA